MSTRMGTVTAKSAYGIMLGGSAEWINFSKPDYQGSPWEAESVIKGDVVQIETDDSGKFIKSICRVGKAQDVTPPDRPPDASDMGMEPPTTQWGYEQRDILMLWESCIKSAVTIYAACISAGIYKEKPESQTILAYAEALKKKAMEEV